MALPGGGSLVGGGTWVSGAPSDDGWLLLLDARGEIDRSCGFGVATSAVASDAPVGGAPVGATSVATLARAGTTDALSRPLGVVQAVSCERACSAAQPPMEPSAGATLRPLRVVATSAPAVRVEAVPGATADHAFADRIGSWYRPAGGTDTRCTLTAWTDEGDGTITLDADVPPDSWVVVASNCAGDSSAGRDSLGRERDSRGSWGACPPVP